jgi:hypothetical protein
MFSMKLKRKTAATPFRAIIACNQSTEQAPFFS